MSLGLAAVRVQAVERMEELAKALDAELCEPWISRRELARLREGDSLLAKRFSDTVASSLAVGRRPDSDGPGKRRSIS